jgi:hypothetical protein
MRKRPIGQILIEKNEISEADLSAALAEQERSGRRLGEILIEQGRTSWLALARAIAEQVLDIQAQPAEPAPAAEPSPSDDPVELIRALAERVANLPPVPDAPPPTQPSQFAPEDPERELARTMAAQVANLDAPAAVDTHVLRLTPSPPTESLDPDLKRHSIEALLKERQRAFIELVTTTETLRMKVAHLEEIIEERDRELTKLRVLRAS